MLASMLLVNEWVCKTRHCEGSVTIKVKGKCQVTYLGGVECLAITTHPGLIGGNNEICTEDTHTLVYVVFTGMYSIRYKWILYSQTVDELTKVIRQYIIVNVF